MHHDTLGGNIAVKPKGLGSAFNEGFAFRV